MLSRFRTLFTFMIISLVAASAFAQNNSTTGGVRGTVTDNTGAVLPGVTVTATNTGTGLTRSVDTDGDGSYSITLLPPGKYRVSAELAGLGSANRDNVTVLLGTNSSVDLKVNPQVSEEITVTASAPVVDTAQSDLTQSVTSDQIQNLPLLGRDFTDLVKLTPGVSETFNDGVSLNGGRGITADYNIDGAETNSDFFGQQRGGSRPPFTFSQAAIQEFQVIRSSFSAEFGRGVGGTLNAVTKSGTNDFEGQLFYYKRDGDWVSGRSLDALGQTFDEVFTGKDSAQYGFAIGGPIVRDRLHFFINTDNQDITDPVVVNDIRNRTEFLALSPADQASFRSRLEAVTGINFDDEFAYDITEDQNTYLVKFDANVGTGTHLSFRDNYSKFHNLYNQSPRSLSNQGDETDKFNQAVIQAESVFGQALYNQFILQYGTEERPIDPIATQGPHIRFNTPSYNFGHLEFLPNNTTEDKWQLKDSISIVRGNHSFKTGIEYIDAKMDNFFIRQFSGFYTYNTLADFVANRPQRYQQNIPLDDGHNKFGVKTYGGFIQDTMTVVENLTVDLGVRYDVQDAPRPPRNVTQYADLDDDFQDDKDNFAPRFGFAYDIFGTGRSVFRGGTGLYYNFVPSILYADPIAIIGGEVGFAINLTCNTTPTNPCPVFPNILTTSEFLTRSAGNRELKIVDKNLEAAQSVRTVLGFEQQIGRNYSFSLEGTYAKLSQQQRFVNVNAVPTGLRFGNLPQYSSNNPNRPFADFGIVRKHVSDGEGSYKGITVSTQRMASSDSRFSWLAHYTWSEAIDQDSNERSTSATFSFDPKDPGLSEGPADYDVTHRVVVSGSYKLPFGINAGGIYTWRTGSPYTIGVGSFDYGTNISIDVPAWVDSSGAIIDLTQANGSTPAQFAAFLNDRGAVLSQRNGENQPNFHNLDFRLSKVIGLPGSFGVELIGEVFNALNTTNTNVGSNNRRLFNTSFTGGTYRFTRNDNFGKASFFQGTPRQYQVAVRVLF